MLVVLLVIGLAAAEEESDGEGGAAYKDSLGEELPPECGVKLPKAKKLADDGVEADDGTDGDDDDEEDGPSCVVLAKSDPIDGDDPPPEIDEDAKDDNDTDTSEGTYANLPRHPVDVTNVPLILTRK